MYIKCEFCGRGWDTTSDIHGVDTCRQLMKEDIAGWRKGVEDANEITQRYNAEAEASKKRAEEAENEVIRLRQENANLQMDVYQATAEWQEEKRRARECEESEKRLREEHTEDQGVIKVLRRHRDTAERFLIDVLSALGDYNSATGLNAKEQTKIALNEKIDEVEKYLASIKRL